MLNPLLISSGKLGSKLVQLLNLGNGSTWPGHIALKVNRNFVKDLLSQSDMKIILIAGTNGKTTTSTLIKTALEKNGLRVFQNESGANLLNGIASTLLLNTNASGRLPYDFGIFEVDENALPQVLAQITPDYLLFLNLFRDQLDRYGEINTIAEKWQKALTSLPNSSTLILNADDAQIAYLGTKTKAKKRYFGLTNHGKTQSPQHAADSVYCPKCGEKLSFKILSFSHLGDWHCTKCGLTRPQLDIMESPQVALSGTYNLYNANAATLFLQTAGLSNEQIAESYKNFRPAFGRQEIVTYQGKTVQLFLSKNPTSFNQSYETIKDQGASTLLIVLNDRIPDGRDISWIWDVDLPEIEKFKHILIAGDRVYDMALRIKYENYANLKTFDNLEEAIQAGISLTKNNETFFILPTYSAMLDVRKILTGKKIL